MDPQECTNDKLWQILVETVHASVMYPTHKSYTRDVILRAAPDISPEDLAGKLNMPLGEALVILQELNAGKKSPP